MSEEDQEKPELEIKSDEDWKTRVKAEDTALDQRRETEKKTPDKEEQPREKPAEEKQSSQKPKQEQLPPLPKATFESLVGMYSTQAMVALGVIPNPISGEAEPQLELAMHFIDLLGVVEEKTKGNLTNDEENLLSTTLHQLRMGFVEISKGGE